MTRCIASLLNQVDQLVGFAVALESRQLAQLLVAVMMLDRLQPRRCNTLSRQNIAERHSTRMNPWIAQTRWNKQRRRAVPRTVCGRNRGHGDEQRRLDKPDIAQIEREQIRVVSDRAEQIVALG